MVNEDGTLSSKIVTTNNKSLDKVYNQTVKTKDFLNMAQFNGD
ncbi:hypothetical protein ACVXZZ_00535 [Staphylococcus aureus]